MTMASIAVARVHAGNTVAQGVVRPNLDISWYLFSNNAQALSQRGHRCEKSRACQGVEESE